MDNFIIDLQKNFKKYYLVKKGNSHIRRRCFGQPNYIKKTYTVMGFSFSSSMSPIRITSCDKCQYARDVLGIHLIKAIMNEGVSRVKDGRM